MTKRVPAENSPCETLQKGVALGTGVGLRYDLTFLVIRLDLGIALHAPYDTGKSGYYNIPKFKDGLASLRYRLPLLKRGRDKKNRGHPDIAS